MASGLGEPWTRDGGIPQGCPLSMMFIVAMYLPWCRYLAARANAADALDAADVFLYRDFSIAPLLDMRRRFKAVMDILDAMIRYGVSLSR